MENPQSWHYEGKNGLFWTLVPLAGATGSPSGWDWKNGAVLTMLKKFYAAPGPISR